VIRHPGMHKHDGRPVTGDVIRQMSEFILKHEHAPHDRRP
jgi:hypothetical protein